MKSFFWLIFGGCRSHRWDHRRGQVACTRCGTTYLETTDQEGGR